MSQSDIVKIIQKAETWGVVREDEDREFYVSVFFRTPEDAEAFRIELMMVASGQKGYEPDGVQCR